LYDYYWAIAVNQDELIRDLFQLSIGKMQVHNTGYRTSNGLIIVELAPNQMLFAENLAQWLDSRKRTCKKNVQQRKKNQ